MKFVELLAMEEARSWGTCSLNEFRRFMGLKPYGSFEEWNPDPEIHVSLCVHRASVCELYADDDCVDCRSDAVP